MSREEMPPTIWASAAVLSCGQALAGEWNYKNTGSEDDQEYVRADLYAELRQTLKDIADAYVNEDHNGNHNDLVAEGVVRRANKALRKESAA